MCCSVSANYKIVCQAIQGSFGYEEKPCQAVVIMNIVYSKKNVMVDIKTGVDKILIYQALFLRNLRAIVLIIIPIIALIEDQERELK